MNERSGRKERGERPPWEVVRAEYLGGANRAEALPAPARAAVAFAGRSNVGKSSLLNALTGRRNLARTSKRPGATRAVHGYRLELRGGLEVDFLDLPGYGYAQRSKAERASWAPLVEAVVEGRAGLRAVVALVDVRRGLQQEERDLVDWVRESGPTPLLVATKLDRLPPARRKPALAALQREAGIRVHGVGSPQRLGIEPLWRALWRLLSGEASPSSG